MRLEIAHAPSEEEIGKKIAENLSSFGYEVVKIEEKPLSEKDVILALFTSETEEDDFLKALPWLAKQREYASIRHLKVMPFYVYHSSKEDPEVSFEGKPGKLCEDVFSGEFKPFGWDLDAVNPAAEFPRVLEEYSE